jgi:hypothetical protein
MKATIDIPDDLYRQVKAKSALEGRAIREVTTDLFERYVGGRLDAATYPAPLESAADSELRERHFPSWFGIAGRLGARAADPSMEAIRESIGKGWAEEVGAKESRLSHKLVR